MNEHLPDDELLSSILDGEADEAARALVEADPALQERLAELQRVSAAVRSAPAVASGDMREQAISAALAAWTAGAAATATEAAAAGEATVTPLVRPGRNPWLLAAAAAAAVVVLLPLGLFVAGNIGDGGRYSSEVAIPVEEDDEDVEVTPRSTTPPSTNEDPSSDGDRTPGPTRGVVAHLGDLPDTAAVANAVANYRASGGGTGQNANPGGSGTDPGQTSNTTTASTQAPPADPDPNEPGTDDDSEPDPGPDPGAPAGEDVPCPELISGIESVELLSASFQGVPSLIMVRSGADSETALVINTRTCEVIAEVAL